MINTSRYVQINDYLLLEYYYEGFERDSSVTETWKLTNNITDTYQYVNDNASKTVTGNVLDWSASVFDSSIHKWALHDIDGSNLIGTDYYTLEQVTKVPYVKYDTVRVHILSGFVFEDLDGFIIEINFKENSGRDFASIIHAYLKSESAQINFNERPLLISERNYDRYVEFQIPSLYFIQDEYWPVASLPPASQDSTFAYNFSHNVDGNPNPGGYVRDSLIYVSVHEIEETSIEDNVTYLKTNRDFDVSFNTSDSYALLAATIQESSTGEYFEYFATWGGEFIDDYIQNLNSSTSGDWGIINQLEVYEQVTTSETMTANSTELQDDNYDSPNLFRPIILNAANAFSFSIEYTMRLYNKLSGEQIVRTASITSLEPKKYGKELLQINVEEGFNPIKVYNKIDEKIITPVNEDVPQPVFNTKYVHTFIQNFSVSVNINSKFGKDFNSSIFGQGKATLFLNNFDNVIRFKILKESKDGKEMLPLNLTNSDIRLVFMLNDGTKTRISSDVVTEVLPDNGEFQFSIDSKLATSLLKSPNNDFYIVSKDDEGGQETLIYQGKFYDFKDYDKIVSATFKTEEPEVTTAKQEVVTKVEAEVEDISKAKTEVVGETEKIVPDDLVQTSDKDTILTDESLTEKEKILILKKQTIDKRKVSYYKRLKPAKPIDERKIYKPNNIK